MRSGLSLLACLMSLATCGTVHGQPVVSHFTPGAVPAGKTIDLTIHGSKLNDPLSIWTSFAAKIELQPADPKQKEPNSRQLKITVDPSNSIGIGGLVVGNPAGASDLALLLIDDLESVADNGKNNSLEAAQSVPLPVALDGTANGSMHDYFKFQVKKDQRLAVEVISARLGGGFDPVVRLLDAAGNVILLVDDDASFGADCRFEHTFGADGDYVVAIHDNQYRNGGRYRLRIGDFPIISAPYPLGGRLGSTAKFEFTSPGPGKAVPVFLRVPDDATDGEVALAAKLPDGKSAAMARLAVSKLPEAMEVEPNGDIKVATAVTLPCAMNGIFQEAGDSDYFTFPATKGQTYSFRAFSRSLGSPSLAFMAIMDANGKQLAETAVGNSEELSLDYTFPNDGMYHLMVRDLLRRGGFDHAYRVEAALRPGFTLAIKNDKNAKLNLGAPQQNGAVALQLQIGRQGYDGEIELSFLDNDKAFRLINGRIPAKAKEHRLIIAVDEDSPPGELSLLRLVGKPTTEQEGLGVRMATLAVLRAKRPQLLFPPKWMDGLFAVATGNKAEPFFAANPSSETAAFSAETGQAQFTIALQRKNGEFKGGIAVTVSDLPAGFSYAVKQDKDNYLVTITGPKGAQPGKHSFRVTSFGEFKGSGQIAVNQLALQ